MAKLYGLYEIKFVAGVLEGDEWITEPRKVVDYQDRLRNCADGRARVAVDNPTPENLERARQAVACCYTPERPYLVKRAAH